MTSPRVRKTSATPRKSAGPKTAQTPAARPEQSLALMGQRDAPLALSSRAIFWSPRYMAPSPTLLHLPFLFWLVETMRPASVVQLGLRDGVGFMGLCQAIDKLGLESVCMGLNLTQDAGTKLPDKLRETHNALYSDFSFILTDELHRAARHMRSARIDLLVIDAAVDEAFLTSLQAHWTDLLSDHAVIVLHAPEECLSSPEAKAFHDNLLQAHPAISFPQAQPGLDVILFGKEHPDRLRHLAQLDLGAPGYLSARSVFTRLGQGIESSQQARSRNFALDKAKAALKDMETRFAGLEKDYKAATDQIEAAQTSEEAQIAENATLQAQIFDLQQALDQARTDSANVEETEKLRAELQKRDAALKDLEEALTAEQAKRKSHWTKFQASEAEKAALAAELAQAQQDAKAQGETHMLALADAQEKLKRSQSKRLQIWEDYEALKLQYQALQRRAQAATASDTGSPDI